MADFLHGVELAEFNVGPRPFVTPRTAIIGLVGYAPNAPRGLTLCQSDGDLSTYGAHHPHNTIRCALETIADNGGALVMVSNVYDSGLHVDAGVVETQTITNGIIRVERIIYEVTQIRTTTGSPITLVLGTDYTWDSTTNLITILNRTGFPDGKVLEVTYKAAVDPFTNIGASEFNAGIAAFDFAMATFTFEPKLLIAPYFSHDPAITNELQVYAGKLAAVALVDAHPDATVTDALAGRTDPGAGIVENFFRDSDRVILCYPSILTDRPYTGGDFYIPLSVLVAAIIAKNDADPAKGYWFSPSNNSWVGGDRPLVNMRYSFTNSSADNQLLNAAGIVTVFAGTGTGYRIWGNRSAKYPSATLPQNFISVRRTADVIQQTVIANSLQFMGLPINAGLIGTIVESVNAFLRGQKAIGAIVDGRAFYDPALNPPVQIANGQIVVSFEFMPPPPLERLTYRSTIDINLLNALNAQ